MALISLVEYSKECRQENEEKKNNLFHRNRFTKNYTKILYTTKTLKHNSLLHSRSFQTGRSSNLIYILKANEKTKEEEEDGTTLLSKAFARIMRKRENERRKTPPTYFKCKKSEHMQFDCPEDKKENKVEKKRFKK